MHYICLDGISNTLPLVKKQRDFALKYLLSLNQDFHHRAHKQSSAESMECRASKTGGKY